MSKRTQTRGNCVYCGQEMTRGGLAKHLRTCTKRQEAQEAADRSRGNRQTLYHLQVQDAWSGSFWLHLEMRGGEYCQEHADAHVEEEPEHDEGLMPFVNSPRVGMCGYWGPADPPY